MALPLLLGASVLLAGLDMWNKKQTSDAQSDMLSKSAAEQRKARALQRQQQLIKDRQQRRALLRQQRIAQARLRQAAVATGSAGSSAESGGLGTLASRTAANFANMSQQQGVADQISALSQSAVDYQTAAQIRGNQGAAISAGLGVVSTLVDIGSDMTAKAGVQPVIPSQAPETTQIDNQGLVYRNTSNIV